MKYFLSVARVWISELNSEVLVLPEVFRSVNFLVNISGFYKVNKALFF